MEFQLIKLNYHSDELVIKFLIQWFQICFIFEFYFFNYFINGTLICFGCLWLIINNNFWRPNDFIYLKSLEGASMDSTWINYFFPKLLPPYSSEIWLMRRLFLFRSVKLFYLRLTIYSGLICTLFEPRPTIRLLLL